MSSSDLQWWNRAELGGVIAKPVRIDHTVSDQPSGIVANGVGTGSTRDAQTSGVGRSWPDRGRLGPASARYHATKTGAELGDGPPVLWTALLGRDLTTSCLRSP